MELELKLTNPQAAAWLIGHLSDRNELVKLVVVYKQLIRSNPTNIALRQSLAATYAALGDEAQARKAAEEVLIIDPSLKKGVEAFIENL